MVRVVGRPDMLSRLGAAPASAANVSRVLIINWHSAQNAGDAVLLEMAVRIVRSVFEAPVITVAVDDDDLGDYVAHLGDIEVTRSFAARFIGRQGRSTVCSLARMIAVVAQSLAYVLYFRLTGEGAKQSTGIRALWKVYSDADVVVGCPGSTFANTGKYGFPFLMSAWTVAFALLLRKPFFVMPQSIGPFRHNWERALLRALYRRAKAVLLREPESLRLAQSLNLSPAKVHLVADLAFAFAESDSNVGEPFVEWVCGLPRPIIGVTVVNKLVSQISYSAWDRYESCVARALSEFQLAHGGTVVFFPQVTGPTSKEDDRVAAQRIAALMDPSCSVHVVNRRLGPSVLREAYGEADLVVATRMHSAIFAMSVLVPTLLLQHLPKVKGMSEMLDLGRWAMDIQDLTPDRLKERMIDLWLERRHVREHLRRRLPELVASAESAGRLLFGVL